MLQHVETSTCWGLYMLRLRHVEASKWGFYWDFYMRFLHVETSTWGFFMLRLRHEVFTCWDFYMLSFCHIESPDCCGVGGRNAGVEGRLITEWEYMHQIRLYQWIVLRDHRSSWGRIPNRMWGGPHRHHHHHRIWPRGDKVPAEVNTQPCRGSPDSRSHAGGHQIVAAMPGVTG